jgi:Family of unknown function (DUF6343)
LQVTAADGHDPARSGGPDGRPTPNYAAGRPDHHDPTGGIGGAPPARSALTLRLVLAGLGLILCATGAVVLTAAGAPGALVAVAVLLATVAVVDLVVVGRRKARGEPG